MKVIVHVTVNYSGGTKSVIDNLIFEQQSYCNLVLVVPRRFAKNVSEDFFANPNLSFFFVDRNSLFSLFGCLPSRIRKEIEARFRCGNIIYHFHNTAAVGILSNLNHIRGVCTLHGRGAFEGRPKLISKFVVKRLVRKGMHIVSCSYDLKSFLETNRICDSVCIHNGVKEYFPPKKDKHSGVVIGFCSYIDEHKGWVYLAQAYEIVKAISGSFKLIFAGSVSPQMQNRFDLFLRNNPEVEYHGFIKDPQKNFFPYVDLVVLPSLMEGLPMTILEAISQGVPVLATNVGGIPEVVLNGETGYIIKRDATDIAEKIMYFQDEDNLNRLKVSTYSFYKSRFTSNRMASEYFKEYENAIM